MCPVVQLIGGLLLLLNICRAPHAASASGVRYDLGPLDPESYAKQPASVSFLPACNVTECTGVVAGEKAFGYLYSALYDRQLQEVHIFLELKHAPEEPEDASNLIDGCLLTHPSGELHHSTHVLGKVMFDNHVHYSSVRVICPVLVRIGETQKLWAGLSLGGKAYVPRIPVTEVPQVQRAQVGACLATMYGTSDSSEQTKEWIQHTRSLGLDGRFHVVLTKQDITFDEGGLAWWRPREASPSLDLPGVDWIHADTFDLDHTWVAGQLLHYAHCMFYHRHVYRHILFWDTDEFLVMKQPGLKLPALLEQTMANRPTSAAVAFHRFAYRSGCHRRLASDPVFPDSAADRAADSAADSGPDAKAATSVAPWHAVYDAREKHTESARSVRVRGWTHLKGRGDKLAVRPLLVDEFYIHFLRSARPGFTVVPATVPVAQAYIKHIRRYSGHDQCASLTFLEPAQQ